MLPQLNMAQLPFGKTLLERRRGPRYTWALSKRLLGNITRPFPRRALREQTEFSHEQHRVFIILR